VPIPGAAAAPLAAPLANALKDVNGKSVLGGAVTLVPGQNNTQTLVVAPRAPTVNLSVPINNYTKPKHGGLFHREPATPQNPARRTVLQRLVNGS
jgi:hypothetical protein